MQYLGGLNGAFFLAAGTAAAAVVAMTICVRHPAGEPYALPRHA